MKDAGSLDEERAHDFACGCRAEFAQGGRQGIEQLDRNRGVVKVRGADLNGRGPTTRKSMTSSIVAMPPMPMIGIRTAWAA